MTPDGFATECARLKHLLTGCHPRVGVAVLKITDRRSLTCVHHEDVRVGRGAGHRSLARPTTVTADPPRPLPYKGSASAHVLAAVSDYSVSKEHTKWRRKTVASLVKR